MGKNFLIQILTRVIPLLAYIILMLWRKDKDNLSDLGQHGAFGVIFTVASLLASGITFKLMTHRRSLDNVFSNLISIVVVVSYTIAVIYCLVLFFSGASNIFISSAPVLIAASGLAQGVFSNYYVKVNRHEILFWVNSWAVFLGMLLAYLFKHYWPILPAFLLFQSQVSLVLFLVLKRTKGARLRFNMTFSMLGQGRWFVIFNSGDILFNIFFVTLFTLNYSMNQYGGFILGKQLIFAGVTIITASMSSFSLPYLSDNQNNISRVIVMYVVMLISIVGMVLFTSSVSHYIIHLLGVEQSDYIDESIVFHSFYGLALPILLFPAMFLNAKGESRIMSVVELSRRILLILLFATFAFFTDLNFFYNAANVLILLVALVSIFYLRKKLPFELLVVSYIYGFLVLISILLFL